MRQRIVSVASALAVCGLLVAIGIRLAASGQFDADKWAIFLHWGTAKFLFDGLISTIEAAACAALVAFAMAFPLALWRLSKRAWISQLAGAYIEFFRAIPLLLLILFMVIELPALGLDWPALGFLVFAMALHHSALTAEVVRAGILSLPRGQHEAALALGMRPYQAMLYVVLPQALRSMLPALISWGPRDRAGYVAGLCDPLRRTAAPLAGRVELCATVVVAGGFHRHDDVWHGQRSAALSEALGDPPSGTWGR